MYIQDFEFDGKNLSEFNFSCISWDGNSNTASPISQIEFTTQRPHNRSKWDFYSAQYSEPLQTVLQVGIYDCTTGSIAPLTRRDLSPIMRWLTRRDGYKLLRFNDIVDYQDLQFFAKISVVPKKHRGIIYALELTIECDRAFAVRPFSRTIEVTSTNNMFSQTDYSDDIGFTPVKITVVPHRSGTLRITNSRLSEPIIVTDCVPDEEIVIDAESLVAYDAALRADPPFARRFNFKFPYLVNTYYETDNVWGFSLPCSATMEWLSPVKVGL